MLDNAQVNWWCVNIHVLNARHLHCLTLHIYVVLKVCVCVRVCAHIHPPQAHMYFSENKKTKTHVNSWFSSSSVAQSCPTLCNPMSYSMPGLPVHHQLLESAQTRVEKWLKYPASRAQEYWRSELCNWERSWGSLQEMLTYTASLFYSKMKVVKDTTWTEHQLYELFAVWNLLNLSKYTFPYL